MNKEIKPQIVVLDAGAQYVDLILKASERQGFPTIILPINTPFDELPRTTKAVIVSGGPNSSHTEGAPMPDPQLWKQDKIPTFNICYGMQAFALSAGGRVSSRAYRADGRQLTTLDTTHPLFTGIRAETQALFTHGDFVDNISSNVNIVGQHKAANGDQIISAIAQGPHVCVQFHPEVSDDTPQGFEIFSNFFEHVAKIKPDQSFLANRMDTLIADKQQHIKDKVNGKHVIAFVSGGVDSVVATMLAKDVVPKDKLHMYYIDNGYMRDEDDSVIEELHSVGLDVNKIMAEQQFEQATSVMDGETVGPLVEVVNPVHKRRIIGEAFVDIQDDIVAELRLGQEEVTLLQGTNAADRIESGHSKGKGKSTDQIKEHHNQVKRVRDLNPVEPLDDLFKEEIRHLAVALGLPDEIAYRQPFPGPGLAVRILGLTSDGFTKRDADDQTAQLDRAVDTLNSQFSAQLTAQLLPVRSVGVGGDSRSHIQAVALEGDVDSANLTAISSSITNGFRSLANRVIYKISGPSLSTLQPIETHPTRDTRATLRQADAIAMEVMRSYKVERQIEQFPVILLPIGSDSKRSIVLRPLFTRAHLTVQALVPKVDLPQKFFDDIATRILEEVGGVSHVFTDLTNKPPATTEWE